MTLNFYYKTQDKKSFIKAVLQHEGKKKEIYISIWRGGWDKNRQRSGDHQIDQKLSELEQRYNQYMNNNPFPTLEDCVCALNGQQYLNKGSEYFTDILDVMIREKSNILNPLTLRKYTCLKTEIKEYEEHTKGRVRLRDINKRFYLSYVDFLINEHNNVNKTILRKIKYVKTVMNYAYTERIIRFDDWDVRIPLKDVTPTRYPLTHYEEEALLSYSTNDMNVRRTVDAFLFCIYSGLRFRDVYNLSANHVYVDEIDGQRITYINMKASKGLSNQTITVLKRGDAIIQKYINNNGRIFSLQENIFCNNIIKAVFKELNLDRKLEKVISRGSYIFRNNASLYNLISFHFARYTYLDRQLSMGVSIVDAQHNMNHAKLGTTQSYTRDNTMRRILETRNKVG